MRKRIGTKIYDTDKAVLVDTTPEGIQVYRKKNSPQFFLYNPNGKDKHEMFFELPSEETEKYLNYSEFESKKVFESRADVRFSKYDRDRIKRHANLQGMSMARFLLMLVDRYEAEHKDRSE